LLANVRLRSSRARRCSLQAAADGMVLGRASHGDAFQRHVGAAIGGQLGVAYKRLVADAEAAAINGRSDATTGGSRRSRSDRNPFREGDAFFEPGNAGKISVIGAVEVIDRDTNQSKRDASTRNTRYAFWPHSTSMIATIPPRRSKPS